MTSLIVKKRAIADLLLLKPAYFQDGRGFFTETWNRQSMEAAGLAFDFVQDNHSLSRDVNTIRGLHFQAPPHAQDKLVRCTRGSILDVAVDIRIGSPTYGKWDAVELTGKSGLQFLIPKGFLHGFITREPNTEVQYKCTDYYAPDCDGAVHWDGVGVDWELNDTPIVSAKDAAAMPFSDFNSPFKY